MRKREEILSFFAPKQANDSQRGVVEKKKKNIY